MDALPSVLEAIIDKWLLEFNRVDCMERTAFFQSTYTTQMNSLCEDIRMNMPLYSVDVMTPSQRLITMNLFLYNCDPHKIGPNIPVTHSRVTDFRRRALSIPPIANIIYP